MFYYSRTLSTLNHTVPVASNATAVSKDESREFMSVFPGKYLFHLYDLMIHFIVIFFLAVDLVRDLTDKAKKYDSKDVSKWFARVCDVTICYENSV